VADEPKKGGGSLLLTAVLDLAGAKVPTLVIMVLVRTCDPPVNTNYKYQREQRAQRKAEPEENIILAAVEEAVGDTVVAEEEDAFLTLPIDICQSRMQIPLTTH
jgi:hypothetical protein